MGCLDWRQESWLFLSVRLEAVPLNEFLHDFVASTIDSLHSSVGPSFGDWILPHVSVQQFETVRSDLSFIFVFMLSLIHLPPSSVHLKTFGSDFVLHVGNPIFCHRCGGRIQTTVVVNLITLVDEGAGNDSVWNVPNSRITSFQFSQWSTITLCVSAFNQRPLTNAQPSSPIMQPGVGDKCHSYANLSFRQPSYRDLPV